MSAERLEPQEFHPDSSTTEAKLPPPQSGRHDSPTLPLAPSEETPSAERETLPVVGAGPLRVEEFTPESSSARLRARPPSLDHRVSRITHVITPPRGAGAGETTSLGIEGYTISDELGRGAQGIVYRATPDGGGRDVAIKVLRPEASDDQLRRFDEAIDCMQALKGVEGVVQFLSRGQTRLGTPFFAMELVHGPSLRALLNKGRLTPRQIVRLLVDVAYAAHRAHDRGYVHRDLKPENILLEQVGDETTRPRVADFGLARDLTQSAPRSSAGGLGGTPVYMAPEQVLEQPVSRRTDVHALGAILYEVIAGSPPFSSGNVATTLHAITQQVPRAPRVRWTGLPQALVPICLRALAKDPNERHPTAATFAQQVQAALDGSDVGEIPTRRLQRPGQLRKQVVSQVRRRALFFKGLALGIALGAVAGTTLGQLL